jgi:hypothetical protein
MRKPNAILHMTVYGLIYGFLLAMVYVWGVVMITGMGWLFRNQTDFFHMVLYTPFVWGALPGAVFGFIGGWILWFLTWNIQLPFIEKEMAARQQVASWVIGGLACLGMGVVLTQLNMGSMACFLIPPPLIAAVTAAYAIDRYFLKLHAWGNIGKMKNKAKLGLTNQLAYEDTAADASFLEAESPEQIEDTRR